MSSFEKKYYYVGPVSPSEREAMSDDEITSMRAAFIAIHVEAMEFFGLAEVGKDLPDNYEDTVSVMRKEFTSRALAGKAALLSILGTKDESILDKVSNKVLNEIPDIYVITEGVN